MKQHITVEQLNELSEKGKETLLLWCIEHRYYETLNPIRDAIIPLLSIGQMIEYLDEYKPIYRTKMWKEIRAYRMCNQLWEAVKEILKAR